MPNKGSLCILLAAGTLLSACAIREAQIPVSAPLAAATDRIELRGMGISERGDFQLGEARGEFERRAERLAIAEPAIVRSRGRVSYRVASAASWPELAGECAWREGTVQIGPIAVTPKRLAMHCDIARDGRPIEAGLVLEDPQPATGTLHGRAERIGTIYYEGQRIDVESIHGDAQGGLPSPTPIGYRFALAGEEIGAVDINGTNKTIFAPRGAGREAVIAGALALSILWDPAVVGTN